LGPNNYPEAILKRTEYPICPADPVTAILLGAHFILYTI